jgi:hypothetical protein
MRILSDIYYSGRAAFRKTPESLNGIPSNKPLQVAIMDFQVFKIVKVLAPSIDRVTF